MILYGFITDDGETVQEMFPMGQCPKEIVTKDGKIAKRVLGGKISMFSKQGSAGSNASKLNAQMTKRNQEAGKRMRQRWKSCKTQ